jgi:hypothetical protein
VLNLEQTASGHYEGQTTIGEPGTYLVQIVQRDADGQPVAQQTAGLVVPYSPEYRRLGQGDALLDELASTNAGGFLDDPLAAFAPTRQPASQAWPLWPTLLLMAALLFPLDVAVRRLRVTAADWRHMVQWVRGRVPARDRTRRPGEPVLLGDLFQARERARRRGARPVVEDPPPIRAQTTSGPPQPEKPQPARPAAQAPARQEAAERKDKPGRPADAEDTLARLRQARDRARRR